MLDHAERTIPTRQPEIEMYIRDIQRDKRSCRSYLPGIIVYIYDENENTLQLSDRKISSKLVFASFVSYIYRRQESSLNDLPGRS